MDESKRIEYPQGTEIFKAQFLLQQIIERLQGESKKPWSSDPNICNMETIRNNINEKIKQTINQRLIWNNFYHKIDALVWR